MPQPSTKCGTHIHITPGPAKEWSLEQVKLIAVGVIRYEDHVQKMLPANRRSASSYDSNDTFLSDSDNDSDSGHPHANKYSRRNSGDSDRLKEIFQCSSYALGLGLPRSTGVAVKANEINHQTDMAAIVGIMQKQRYVLWNLRNLLGKKKTIEFRGGRGLRGPVRTKWWIAFVVGFVDLLVSTDADIGNEATHENVRWQFMAISSRAGINGLSYLPPDYRNLNETMAVKNHSIEPTGPTSTPPPSEPSREESGRLPSSVYSDFNNMSLYGVERYDSYGCTTAAGYATLANTFAVARHPGRPP
ncbi:hypothetical protein LTR95_001233 [Oleoguttula sp. CCFEE 5521]